MRWAHSYPIPSTVTALKVYLGLLTYYGKFLLNKASILALLYHLLWKDTRWNWGVQQQQSFDESEELLASLALLVHYDPTKVLIFSCDALQYKVRAVLS